MARIRSIKPEFYRHHELFLAEKQSGLPIRVAFSGLWLCADKEGRFKWNPIHLKLDVLPYDEIDFSDVLSVLENSGFIVSYDVAGKKYGIIPTFKEHQRITGSEATAESKLPCPPIDYEQGNNKEATRKQQGRQEGKGREREGNGIIGKGVEDIPVIFELQGIYNKSWDEYKAILNGQSNKLSEVVFTEWKKFVDFIWENNYQELFKAKFVTPIDFGRLMTEKGFLKERWKRTVEGILSTGVNPSQNLFFRIPQYMNYDTSKTSTGSVGRSIEFDKP